jgi:AcrR family transcriptional regulator
MRKIRTFSKDKELVTQRRNQIVKVATSLIAKKGYNRINTRELASSLGMSIGGLYHYIGSKEDILYLIINFTSDLTAQTIDRFKTELKDTDPSECLYNSIKIYLDTVDSYRDFHNFVNHIMLSLSLNDRKIVYQAESRVVDYFENLLKEGMEKGDFEVSDPKIMAHNIVVIANAWANRGWYLNRHYTVETYTNEQVHALLKLILKHVTNNDKKSVNYVLTETIT